MSDSPEVEINLVQGEDFACQMFWASDYGEPVPISEPVALDVRDGYGQIAMRFVAGTEDNTMPRVNVNGQIGFMQFTAPASYTAQLLPGRYIFDLFAAVADSSAPFPRQQQQVISGYFVVHPRVTVIENTPSAIVQGAAL